MEGFRIRSQDRTSERSIWLSCALVPSPYMASTMPEHAGENFSAVVTTQYRFSGILLGDFGVHVVNQLDVNWYNYYPDLTSFSIRMLNSGNPDEGRYRRYPKGCDIVICRHPYLSDPQIVQRRG
jgi:hypothetical protein